MPGAPLLVTVSANAKLDASASATATLQIVLRRANRLDCDDADAALLFMLPSPGHYASSDSRKHELPYFLQAIVLIKCREGNIAN